MEIYPVDTTNFVGSVVTVLTRVYCTWLQGSEVGIYYLDRSFENNRIKCTTEPEYSPLPHTISLGQNQIIS